MAQIRVSSGVTSTGIILTGIDSMFVSSGGIANSTTVNSDARVYLDGMANSMVLNSGGFLQVLSGGTATNIIVSGGADLSLAVAHDTYVQWTSDGNSFEMKDALLSGYTFDDINIHVYSGGAVIKTTLKGGLTVASGGTANSMILNSGWFSAESGGTVTNTVLNSGGQFEISSGGITQNTTVNSGGEFWVSSGGMANSTTLNGGIMRVWSGGTANSFTVNASSYIQISPGGTANNAVVNCGGDLWISSGVTALNITENGGYVVVFDGADVSFAPNTIDNLLLEYESATLHSGTTANSTTVSSGGFLDVYSGGTANSTMVSSGGFFYISSGGMANNTNVNSTGRLFVYSDGTANSTTVNSGGSLWVYSGGTANSTTVYFRGNLNVFSGGMANRTTISSGGWLGVRSGGTANSTTVNSGALVQVFSGAADSNATVNSGGSLWVYSGGTANGTTVNSGGSLDVSSGGTALNIMENGGYVVVYDGADVTFVPNILNVQLLEGGQATVHSGTTANKATVPDLFLLDIFSGGIANDTTLYGQIRVSSGGTAINTTVVDGILDVYSGGTANSISVDSSSWLNVYSGGTATNVVWTPCEGYMRIEYGAYVTFASEYSGVYYGVDNHLLNNAKVMESIALCFFDDCMYVFSGGTATNTAIQTGKMYVQSGGIANKTAIYGCASGFPNLAHLDVSVGGMVSDTTIYNGILNLYGGTANNTIVDSCGHLYVYSGGVANGVSHNEDDGILLVYSGGKLTGQINFNTIPCNGGILSAYKGAILDFDISELSPGNATARVHNLSFLQGTPLYTITVSGNQTDGIYSLADGAAGFRSAITMVNASGARLGTLTVGETVNVGGTSYTLNLDGDDVLSVTVGAAEPVPPVDVAKSDIDDNGISDVLFQYTGGDYQLGYWINGTNEWRGQGLAKPPEWEVLGSYDMNNNGMADAVLVGNVEVGGVKGAYIGYYLDSVDTDANWQNIGYLNNADDIGWKNKVGNLTGTADANSIIWYAPELYALGAWTDGTDNWVSLSNGFGGDEWTLVGCGDFAGTGKDSVVMAYNSGAKYYAVGIDGVASELASSDSGWAVRAIADFAGDGKDDIVAFHKETGLVAMWGDGDSSNWSQLGQLDASDWFVVGAGDYDGDAKDDLLVRQYSTGMLGYYTSGDMSQWNVLGYGVDISWTVIA